MSSDCDMTHDLQETLFALETHLLKPEVRSSVDELKALLCEEFVEITGSGRMLDREAIIAALASEGEFDAVISDFTVRRLAPDLALATYRALVRESGKPPLNSMRTSVWKQTDGNWRILFHQGTVIV